MDTSGLLLDGFGRIESVVHAVLDGIDPAHLTLRVDADANSVAWLVWHLARVQDDHIAGAFGSEQVWTAGGWYERFGLPFDAEELGYGQSSDEVAQVRPDAELLGGYLDAVLARTREAIATTSEDDLDRVVDENWDPPVTLGVRLISVLSDDLQHAGQAAYVRGLAERG